MALSLICSIAKGAKALCLALAMMNSISNNEPEIDIMSIPEFEETFDIPFLYSTDNKVYLDNYMRSGIRVNQGVIGNHSGDSVSYVIVSSGVTYYSDFELAYFNSDSLNKDSVCTSISFPFTPSVNGYIVVNDTVDGSLTDLGVYYINGSSGSDDPDEPITPGVPNVDLESVTSRLDNIIKTLQYIVLFQIILFSFPLICSWSKKNVKGGD